MKHWKMNSALNWTLESPGKIKPPTYFTLDDTVRKRIISLLEKTVMAPGGTDWRSPFILASKAETAPDVIYFMTDGQFDDQTRMLNGINQALKETSPANPIINVIGVSPQDGWDKALKALCSKHQGKYTEIR